MRPFLARVFSEASLIELFEYLPDVYVFAKDRKGRFVFCNAAFAKFMGVQGKDGVLGQTDQSFSPRHLCEKYARDDRAVLDSGKALVEQIELVKKADGSIGWYCTTKVPITSKRGAVIAVAGIMYDLGQTHRTAGRFLSMAPVVETIMNEYSQPLSVPELAQKIGLSRSQLERQFKARFRIAPHEYIVQVRVDAASDLLATTDLSIAHIAQETGFCDQGHLTRHFARRKGVTPHRYRNQYRGGPGRGIRAKPGALSP
ncbi:MAG: helix-turn-helix domain-containing protein [Acidobacteriota bacterium]